MTRQKKVTIWVVFGFSFALAGWGESPPDKASKFPANIRELLSRVDASFDGTAPNPALQEELSAALRHVRGSGNLALEAAVRARLGRLFLANPVIGEAHVRRALELSQASGDLEVQAAALFAQGEIKLNRRLPRRALEPLARSAEIFHRLTQPRGASTSLDLLSRAQEQLGLYEEALANLEKAREVRPKGWPLVREAAESMRLGRLNYVLGRYREGAQHLDAPLANLRALRESLGAPAYERFLEALHPLIEKFKAGKGEEFSREDAADLAEGTAQGYFHMAEWYGVSRPPQTALPELRREEEEWLDLTLADGTVTAKQITDLLAARNGDHFVEGRLPRAMTAWFTEQAARINERLDKQRQGGEPAPTPDSIEEASLAAMQERTGQASFDKVIGRQFQRAAREMEDGARKIRIGQRLPVADPGDPDLARLQQIVWAEMVQEEAERPAAPPLLNSMVDWMEDLSRRMLPRFQEEAAKNIGQEDAKVVEAMSCEAELHNFLGRLLALDGSLDQAAEQYRQAWEIVEATDLRALQLWIPRSNERSPSSLGYDIVSEHGSARTLGLPSTPTLSRPCGNEIDGSLDLWWGDFLSAAERDQEALQRYRRAVAKGVDQSRPLALGGIAAVYERQGKRQEALETYRQAIDAVESILGQIRLDQLVSSFVGHQAPLYARAIDLATELTQPDLVFELAERARARAFLNQIGNRRIDLHGVPPDLITQWQAAREKLEDAQARRRVNSEGPSAEEQTVADANAEDLARQAYEGMLERLKRASPEYASMVAVEVASREEVQELLPEETTMINYFVLDRRTLAWVIDKNNTRLVELHIEAEDLQNQVKTFRLQVANRLEDDAVARDLYATLIAPLKPFLRHQSLVLVPHGPLHYLPFAALRDDSGRFLIEDYALVLVPSASSLRFAGRGKAADGALVLGDPDGTLPHADREAEAVAALYGTNAYHGATATEALVQKEAGRTGVLHLAAHAVYDPVHPLFSRINLAPGDGQDGRLEVHEIYRLDLSATRLVVLSACDTALGERSDGDDVVGLSRALLATGAPAVITTLWKIDDQAAGALMTALHRRLRQGDAVAVALRAAQLEILAQPEWRSPFFWAAFTLTGLEGVPGPKPEPRFRSAGSPQASPSLPAAAPSVRQEEKPEASDPESELVIAMFRAKERAHKSCRPVSPDMAKTLSRFFPPFLVSAVCWAVDTHGEILQGLTFHDGDLPVVTLEDVLVFRTEKDSLNPILWSHSLLHVFQYQRVGIPGFVRLYLRSWNGVEQQAREMEQFVAGRLENRLETDASRRCAVGNLWNGVDFESYCKSKGYRGVDLVEPSAHGWKCVKGDETRLSIDMSDACRWQYCGTLNLPFIEGSGGPYSWFCVDAARSSTSKVGGFDPGYVISGRNIVFSYTPTTYNFGGVVSSVVVAGTFNGWTTDSSRWRASDDDHDGRWTLTAYRGDVTCGSQFKFVVNGSAWQQPSKSWPADHLAEDGYGGFNLIVSCK